MHLILALLICGAQALPYNSYKQETQHHQVDAAADSSYGNEGSVDHPVHVSNDAELKNNGQDSYVSHTGTDEDHQTHDKEPTGYPEENDHGKEDNEPDEFEGESYGSPQRGNIEIKFPSDDGHGQLSTDAHADGYQETLPGQDLRTQDDLHSSDLDVSNLDWYGGQQQQGYAGAQIDDPYDQDDIRTDVDIGPVEVYPQELDQERYPQDAPVLADNFEQQSQNVFVDTEPIIDEPYSPAENEDSTLIREPEIQVYEEDVDNQDDLTVNTHIDPAVISADGHLVEETVYRGQEPVVETVYSEQEPQEETIYREQEPEDEPAYNESELIDETVYREQESPDVQEYPSEIQNEFVGQQVQETGYAEDELRDEELLIEDEPYGAEGELVDEFPEEVIIEEEKEVPVYSDSQYQQSQVADVPNYSQSSY